MTTVVFLPLVLSDIVRLRLLNPLPVLLMSSITSDIREFGEIRDDEERGKGID